MNPLQHNIAVAQWGTHRYSNAYKVTEDTELRISILVAFRQLPTDWCGDFGAFTYASEYLDESAILKHSVEIQSEISPKWRLEEDSMCGTYDASMAALKLLAPVHFHRRRNISL